MNVPDEVMRAIDQQKTQARDAIGRRWIRCEFCGWISLADDFLAYGGNDAVNLGRCRSCGWADGLVTGEGAFRDPLPGGCRTPNPEP